MSLVDQTMPALFAPAGGAAELLPIAQLGAGPDGTSILARKGEQLVELIEPSFAPSSARWEQVETRLRAIAAVQHPAVRGVLSIEREPPQIMLEGDSAPPLAEMIEQVEVDLTRLTNMFGELARAIAAAHHVGITHGRLQPWTVHVGAGDHPRIDLVGLDVRSEKHEWIDRCLAPELRDGGEADAAADVYAIGRLLDLCVNTNGRTPTPGVIAIINEACNEDPELRPTASALVRKLVGAGTLVARTSSRDIAATRPSRPQLGLQLGRFELVKQLGVGAMGEVWEANDSTGGEAVAIKLLKPEVAADEDLLRRFRKEARVLAKVGSPYIANFIDLNEDRGLHYLVLELCRGGSVAAALRRQGKLPERLALSVIADACRALAEPHRLGVVHRDIKPDNMMFVRAGIELEATPADSGIDGCAPKAQLVKLGDFGIARLVEKVGEGSPQGATREGSVLGTPEFMAPEQCQGVGVTPATDVYALGCALFALIAGRPPFVVKDDNQMHVILAHLNEQPPRLDAIEPATTPAVADLVARCLTKDPKARPQDAAELLGIIEQLCDGSTALITAHPSPPIVNEKAVQTYTFEWDLQSSPEALWPFVSNTEKMNRATGLAPVQFEIEQLGTTGTQRVAGLQLKWREHPYEWIEGSRHTVLRVFEKGVLRWYVAEVTLERTAGGGTKLRNTVRMEPRGLLARVLSRFEIGVKYRRKLEKVYTRLDGVLAAGPRPEIDPIAPENVIAESARERVEEAGERLRAAGVDADATEALVKYLLHASDQDVARIRPLEIAKKFGVKDDAMIDACLHAAHHGVLAMVWDVICPSCRIPSSVVDSLKKIEEHGTCKTCNLGFDLDFSRAIELAFRTSANIRAVETRTFCIGGPAHFPHVAAQVRLQASERFALPLSLGPGFYIVRSPQLARAHELRVSASGGVRRVDITLGERGELPAVTAGDQLLTLINLAPREILVRVERAGDRAYALTAARAMACPAFRELFPDQTLAPGRLMAVTQATLVVAQLDDAQALFRELGDVKAFPVASKFFDQIATLAKEYGGSLVKTFGGLAIAAFERPGPALDVALALGRMERVKVAVHRGPMMALTQGGRLDYFGQHVETALQLAGAIPTGLVGVTQAVCSDVGVAERLQTLDRVGIQPTAAGGWVLHIRPQ